MQTNPSMRTMGKFAKKTALAALMNRSSVVARETPTSKADMRMGRLPVKKPAIEEIAEFEPLTGRLNSQATKTAGAAMLKVFSPKVVKPPNWKRIPWSKSARNMTGKAAQPIMSPIKPLKTKWVELKPTLTRMREAVKKTADKMAALGMSSSLMALRPL
jgi:hypothetical protein